MLGLNRLRQTIKLFKMAQDQQEKIFADGFIFKRNEKAPEFVIGRMSLKADEAIAFIKQHVKNGWINLDVKQARSGNFYVELDTFESKNDSSKESAVNKYEAKKVAPVEEEAPDLPF
jgi:hypothetical protein